MKCAGKEKGKIEGKKKTAREVVGNWFEPNTPCCTNVQKQTQGPSPFVAHRFPGAYLGRVKREAKLQMRLRFSISFAVGTQGPAGVPNTDCVTQALKDTRKKTRQQK